MKDNRDLLYLDHIIDSMNKIIEYTDGLTQQDFMDNEMVQDAVERNFEIVGEAIKHISAELKAKHPELPWSFAARMRDTLIHGYADIDLNIVWETAKKDVSPFCNSLTKILEELDK